MKWAYVGVDRFEKWRLSKLQEFLGEGNQLSYIEWGDGEETIETVFQGLSHVRFGCAIQIEAASRLSHHSAWTALLGITDGMLIRDGRWWPLCATYEAFCKKLSEMDERLDTSASAFISGGGSMARAAIAALFKCGYRSFRIATPTPDASDEIVDYMRKKFFGIDLEVVPIDNIVLLAGVSSIFVNTLSEDESVELEQEISYLNFLKRPGAIIDTSFSKEPTLLLKEASDSAIRTIDGWDFAATRDEIWVEWAFGIKIDCAAYLKVIREGHSEI